MSGPSIAVVIPTRNPNRSRLQEVLVSLQRQTLPADQWTATIVDNGSEPALTAGEFSDLLPQLQVVREPQPGLLDARLAGLQSTTASVVVFIDDDTVADEVFLQSVARFFEAHPQVATAGGKIRPRYLTPPPPWIGSFEWMLALRDNGEEELLWGENGGARGPLPSWTPIGAGLAVRRSALVPSYLEHVSRNRSGILQRSWKGQGMGGVEDKDLVLHTLAAGWQTGYCPSMQLTHLIPANRLTPEYFVGLLPALQKMWAQTLHAHGLELHSPINPITLPLRKLKAWWVFKAWVSLPNRLQWLQTCGYLEGLAENHRNNVRYARPARRT